MAARLIEMAPGSFAAIQARACMQADPRRDIAYDRETMALFTVQLNHIYKEYSVYFLLVGTPELGLSSFHAPPRNVLMFFYQHKGIWSAACSASSATSATRMTITHGWSGFLLLSTITAALGP